MTHALPYRPCVGICLFDARGRVFAGRRLARTASEEHGSDRLWQMPQGGMDAGEDAEAAARRELWEETGVRSVALLGSTPDWLTYDLPDHLLGVALRGRYRGQKQMWFAFRFTGASDEIAIAPPPGGHAQEFEAWEWAALADMPARVVAFKRPVYEAVARHFAPFARPA